MQYNGSALAFYVFAHGVFIGVTVVVSKVPYNFNEHDVKFSGATFSSSDFFPLDLPAGN